MKHLRRLLIHHQRKGSEKILSVMLEKTTRREITKYPLNQKSKSTRDSMKWTHQNHSYRCSHSCPVCQKYFSDKKKVRLHVQRVHKQIKDHNCDECEYRAHTKWDILRHIKTNHMPQDPDPKDFRICPDCGKVLKVETLLLLNGLIDSHLVQFQGNNHLNFHIKTKHLKLTKYSCDMCDFKSYGKYEIRSHIEIHHLPLGLSFILCNPRENS